MSLGRAPDHEDLYRSTRVACEARLPKRSIFRLLARDCHRLFADEVFADLFAQVGRNSVPPRVVAVVMVLQRLHGLSDREAVDTFAFDLRWKYAAGALDFDHPGFVHTVLVDMRARLRRSKRPNRVFEVVLEVAREAGLVGRKRVLDSTALYDAVTTQDTVTMVRSAIRGVLQTVDDSLGNAIRGVLKRDDDYRGAGKPACDWEDATARETLVDDLARDAYAALTVFDGRELTGEVRQAVELLATVVGQDIEQQGDGVFRIIRGVAPNRIISTVDPESRHGHKTVTRGFDGYKGHIAVDPDSEIIVATEVTAANVGDAAPAPTLVEDILQPKTDEGERAEIYGDASYGTAEMVERIEEAGAEANVKVQAASPARRGLFTQDHFTIDTKAQTACCPNGLLVQLRLHKDGRGVADFGIACSDCPLRSRCTDSPAGRSLTVHRKYETLLRARRRQADPTWKQRYRATRPKVERKIAHLMRRRHGGRRARVRGRLRVGHDFALLAASVNLVRLAALGVGSDPIAARG
jgi:Transposase DDE domain/Transposase domain (DUF772)